MSVTRKILISPFQGHIYYCYVDHHITQIPDWYPRTYCTPFISNNLLFSSQIVDYLVTNKVIEYIQHSFCLFTLIQAVVNWTLENQSNPIELNLWIEFKWLKQFINNQIKHRIFCLFDFQTNQTRSHKSNWTEHKRVQKTKIWFGSSTGSPDVVCDLHNYVTVLRYILSLLREKWL